MRQDIDWQTLLAGPNGEGNAGPCRNVVLDAQGIVGFARDQRRRWACRLGPSAKGRCCHDLPPCLPVRSLRSRRGRFTIWMTVASIGLILLLFGSRMHADLVDPGTLYTGHAEIEACADCHLAFNTGPDWLGEGRLRRKRSDCG